MLAKRSRLRHVCADILQIELVDSDISCQNVFLTEVLMMASPKRILAADLSRVPGQQVCCQGWLYHVRKLGKLCFLILKDRTGFAQIALEKPEAIASIKGLHLGTVIEVEGTVAACPQSDLGVEIVQPTLTIISAVREAPPLDYSKPVLAQELDFILDNRALSLRNSSIAAVFKIQAEISHAFRCYMIDHVDATEYFPPNLIGSSSEGGAEFFRVDYFGYDVTLAQSSQLYKQIMVGVFERAFAIAPFFRAEKSHTTRHLTEGKQLEFEMGFFRSWEELMDILEGLMRHINQHLQARCSSELTTLGCPPLLLPENGSIPRLRFKEAQELYFQLTGIDDRAEPDLSPAAERALCSWARQEHGSDCIFITHWLKEKRPFYSFPDPDAPELTYTFDLLCKGSEIVSGGQRRHTADDVCHGLVDKGLDPQHFDEYLSIFKFGMPYHGGFGMGLERLTMTYLGLENIREASLFPSDPRRVASSRLRARIIFGEQEIRNEIIRQLKNNGFDFEHHVHQPTISGDEANRVHPHSVGVKALIVRGKSSGKNFQLCIPTGERLDTKAVAAVLGEKIGFEDPDVIRERYGLRIGGVPPLGNLLGLETIFDRSLEPSAEVAFNCGLPEESVTCSSESLIQIVQPRFEDIITLKC